MVQELLHIPGCTIGQLPEWEGGAELRPTSSFSVLVHTEHLLSKTKFFIVDACHLKSFVK